MGRVLAWPLWWGGVLLSVTSGFVFGLLPTHVTWFDPVDVDDHMVSAGGYVGSVIVLLGAATALEAWDGPRNARRTAVVFAGLFTILALREALVLDGTGMAGMPTFLDGVTGAFLTPWALFHLAAGFVGWVLITYRNHSRASSVRERDNHLPHAFGA